MTNASSRAQTLNSSVTLLISVAIWFALIAGLGEVAALSIKKFYLGRLIKVGNDFIWMSPVAALVGVVGVAIPFLLLSLWRPNNRRLFVAAIGVFAFWAAFDLVLMYSGLATYAKAIIAAGLAVQFVRMLAPRQRAFEQLVRLTLPMMTAVVIALAIGLYGYRALEYRRGVAALPPISSSAPNVVLIVLDTVRARNLSLHGYSRATTPNLEEWAKTAVVFDEAVAPASWTFPSHATMFTGRWPHEVASGWQTPLDDRYPTLAEVLRDRGYSTAGFAANVFFCTEEFGIARGFLHYEDYPVSRSQFLISTAIGRELFSFSLNTDLAFRVREWIGYQDIPGRRNAEEINAAFVEWLDDRQDSSRPFFAFLNYLDAHQPFLPPAPFDTRFRGPAPRGNPTHWWDRTWSPQEVLAETDAYDGAIAYLDHQLGRLADELRLRGEFDDTLVIVTSDHGEHLGEHGFMRHGQTLYRDVLRVPLVIRFPGRITAGVRVREAVSLRDIPQTVLALLNLSCDQCFPGEPLTRFWMGAGGVSHALASPAFSELKKGLRIPDRYPNSKGDLKSLIADQLHYIVNADGSEELYNHSKDPAEALNLARSPSWEAALARMRRGLASVVQPDSSSASAAAQPSSR
jgi:arylsulfatase A-like enzyme